MRDYQFQSHAPAGKSVSPIYSEVAGDTLRDKKRTRVLMVGMHLTKTRGGITTLTEAILNSRLKDDYEFIYVSSQAEDFGKIRKVGLAVSAVVRFFCICLIKRPRVVYVHIGSNASLYRESAFILLAKVIGIRVLSHFHAGDIDSYYPRQHALGKRFIRTAIGLSDKIIAVSRESGNQVRSLAPLSKIAVLSNAIDTAAFQSITRPLGKTGPLRLLFVGAIGKLKGENDLIRALERLKDRGVDLKVSFLGYGAQNLANRCAELGVSDLIEHLGPVSIGDRIGFFERADVFVLPTYAEAMPISVIEAMAAGLAVVTTPVGGIPELIRDGEDGILFPAGDINALVQTISLLASNETERSRLGANARQKVMEQMDFAGYAERLGMEISSISVSTKACASVPARK